MNKPFQETHPSLQGRRKDILGDRTGQIWSGIYIDEDDVRRFTLDKAVVRAAINKHDRCGLVCDLKEMTHGNCAWNIRQELGLDLMDAPGLDKDGDA